MRLIRLTAIEGRAIAIVPGEIVSIEKGDFIERWENEYGFRGAPTRVILKQFNYTVMENFDTVRKLIEGANDDSKRD